MMEGRNAETKKTDENVQPVPPIHQYSRERLLELKKVPAARSKPLGLSKEFYTSDGVWDPEKWFKAFIASPEGSPLTISDGRERRRPLEIDREFIFRRRLSDPKERLRDDCIVLSPQRRSFGTGCHVTLSGIGRQVSCPPDFKESAQRERTRRIGSGRIQLEKDYNCRYDNRDDRFERNDSGRGDNFRNNYDRRDINPRRINTPNRRRNIRRHEDDPAPEWFTDGPNSKTDTIELRGFENTGEQAEEDMDEVNMPVVNRKEYLSHINEEDIANISVSERNGSLETNESSSPEDSPPSDNVHGTPPQTSPFFDLDEFFKINIPILGMMDGGLEETDVTQGSRFSRWFSQTANHDNNSRRSSIVEETGCIRDLIETHSSTTISSSSTSQTIMGVSSMHPSQDPLIQHRNHQLQQLQQQQQQQQPQPPPPPPQQHHPPPYHHKPPSQQQPSLPPVTQLQQMHSLQPSSLPPALQHQLSQPIQQSEDTGNSLFSLGPHPVNSRTLSPPLPSRAPPSPQSEQQQSLGPSILSGIAPSQGSIVSSKRAILESLNQDTTTTTITTTNTTANNINNHHHHHHHHHSSSNNSVLESLFNLNCPVPEKPDSGSPTNVNVHDASAQLKALLFGKAGRDSVAASPTPGINAYGMPGRVKTVAEIEADLHHQMSPNGMVTVSPLEVPDCSGDMSAFNKLLSMMKAAAVDNSKPHIPDRRSPPNLPAQPPPTIPYLTSGQNEFLHALNRNKEQQLQIQQQTLNQIRMQQQHQHRQHNQEQQQQQQQQKSNQPTPQQQPTPVLQQQPTYVSGVTPTGSGQQTSSDAILNFIKQNPDIIAKPASPNPQLAAVLQHVGHRNLSPGGPPLHPTTSQYLQQNLLSGQPGSVHTSQPRIPSPIMFSQQPPVHLSAPAPVHPGPLVQSSLGQPISNLTSATNIRPHSVLPRVNSPKDMMSFKKDMEEHERFLRKQQERSKSPVSISRGIPTPVNMGPKTSVSVAFTPTSVIRKMHSEKAVEKERQAKQDGCSLNSYSAQKTLMKNQMYIDSVLKDSYSNNVCSDSSRSSPLSLICDKKDIGQGPSVNGHPLPRSQDGLPNQHSGQTPFLSQSHPNLPIDSSIIGGSLNISGSCNSSATPSPSSAKSSKLTPHKGPMSTAGCGEILAAQLFNHEQQNPSPSQTLSSSPCDQSKSLRALMGQGMMQNLTSQLLQSGISNTATSAAQQQLSSSLAGRPIVKGSTSTTSCLRPTTGVQSLTSMNSTKGERPLNYPSSSTTNMELAKVLDLHRLQQQQQQQQQQHPSQQPTSPLISNAAHGISQSLSVNSSPPFGIPVSNRMPLPRPLPNIGVHPAANVLQMQFMLHGRISGSSSQKSSSSSLGNMTNTSGADVLKWFDSDSLRTQLPNMPLPPQGQKVFTVDELERNQQAV
ncbi:eukaryotic translation initiation factor 4E transporter isoform X2 [Octopus bimaculoides]|uniref:eukaryotic translation initiation factor 4E transporter isoform X2 n=1 Tax=Octopus bimaculoides TaxID=37653 RepID=UPI00071CC158|nr:eukaryotic translation initiation factor 4E transporter isoform X2 [Octopus bimaculoides]|eukprot:XP_014775627.1 PREDICTED: eukaryotic translation initiation factor 4E transporter-like isoform X2 [Octopus bimaculoides]